ncbi:hypothetical protein K458DRAFT_427567 [Lentithecium fluviatile CBS 122367]|uniref:Uncharacterized protein n=1 Tax=Lentithecium fluviatile CBS 122367 TaxID=1168545 RepID=A0A6G1JGU5_9PLEO|nr:hypothetical protein K458DRAFT_427567 [Lentithecium fluviatile CBS 122367]
MTWYEIRKSPNGTKSVVKHKDTTPDIPDLSTSVNKKAKSPQPKVNPQKGYFEDRSREPDRSLVYAESARLGARSEADRLPVCTESRCYGEETRNPYAYAFSSVETSFDRGILQLRNEDSETSLRRPQAPNAAIVLSADRTKGLINPTTSSCFSSPP